MTTVFLSGSRKLSRLNAKVRERVDNIVSQGFAIVVGDANGADKAIQAYLHSLDYEHVTVYCAAGKCRNNIGSWPTEAVFVPADVRGREFYTTKDKAMADKADFGFVLWDGKSAGAIENVVELLKRQKRVLVFLSTQNRFFPIASVNDLRGILDFCEPDESSDIDKKIGLKRSIRELDSQAQVQLGV